MTDEVRPGGPGLDSSDSAFLSDVAPALARLRERLAERIIGQRQTTRELLLTFLAGGHALLIGVPGLAKTLMIRSLAELLDLDYARIQFTPDLMPSDITGTSIIARNESTGQREFKFRAGPIFTHMLLADEINRTPPKTQAALLEAMEEQQVTVGGTPHRLDHPFFVLATQNPIEQEGTYPLPVTQLDRFLFQIDVDYPDADTEFEMVALTTTLDEKPLTPVLSRDEVLRLLKLPRRVRISERILGRATRLVRATRSGDGLGGNAAQGAGTEAGREWLAWGAGPRAVQAILTAARAAAVLDGRSEVNDDDYEEVLYPAMRHRMLLNYHAEAEHVRADDVLRQIREEIGDAPPPPEESAPGVGSRLVGLLRSMASPTPQFKTDR